jgi:hypothetical protein
MRNLALMWVVAGLSVVAVQADTVQSWESGETTVTLTDDGTLRVSGKGGMENYDSIHYAPWRHAVSLITGLVIENGVTSIGNYAFAQCTSLTFVTIPDGVITIGERAFYHCRNLTSVTIPNSVTYIGIETFYDCWRLEYAKIIGNTQIDKEAFKDCRMLQHIIILNPIPPPRWSFYSVDPDACMYVPKNSIDAYIATYNTGYITRAEFISGGIVRGSKSSLAWGSRRFECVKDLAFAPIVVDDVIFNYDTTELIQYLKSKHRTSYTIPSNVIKIAPYAFNAWNCTGLKSIEVAADNVHYSSADGVLFNKDKTRLIRYPNDKDGASYVIPGSVAVIEEGAFAGCTNLTSITIPKNVTTIGKSAFFRCTSLASVTIPQNVTYLEDYTFYCCFSLTSVTLPKSVTYIDEDVFGRCTSLQLITSKNPTPPQVVYYISPTNNLCVYVPKGSCAAYRAAEGWKEFECIKEIDDGFTGVRITVMFLAVLLLSAAVFVIIKKSRINKGEGRRK